MAANPAPPAGARPRPPHRFLPSVRQVSVSSLYYCATVRPVVKGSPPPPPPAQVIVERAWGEVNTHISLPFKLVLLFMEHVLGILNVDNARHVGAVQTLGRAVLQFGCDVLRSNHSKVWRTGLPAPPPPPTPLPPHRGAEHTECPLPHTVSACLPCSALSGGGADPLSGAHVTARRTTPTRPATCGRALMWTWSRCTSIRTRPHYSTSRPGSVCATLSTSSRCGSNSEPPQCSQCGGLWRLRGRTFCCTVGVAASSRPMWSFLASSSFCDFQRLSAINPSAI